MAWCRLEADFREHRKPKRLAARLGVDRPTARGLLAGLWSWAVTQAPDGCLGDITKIELAEAADWSGDPSKLWDALVSEGLLDDEDGKDPCLHGYLERAGSFREASRKQAERDNKASRTRPGHVPDTSASCPGERSREEMSGAETRGAEQSGAGAPAAATPALAVVPLTPQAAIKDWSNGDPLTVPGHFAQLAECSGGTCGCGLSGKTRGLAQRILAGGPVESWEYTEALDELKRQNKAPNTGLLAAVVARRRSEAGSAAAGSPLGAPTQERELHGEEYGAYLEKWAKEHAND